MIQVKTSYHKFRYLINTCTLKTDKKGQLFKHIIIYIQAMVSNVLITKNK